MSATIKYTGWPGGMDNRSADHDLLRKQEEAVLRDAVNIDVLSSGKLRLRDGIKQVVADADAHSVFSDGSRLVWATGDTLKVADANFDKATALTDSRLSAPLSWLQLNGELYFSNEQINGKLIDYAYEPWGVVPPLTPPVCTPGSSGPYRYQATCTFVTAAGEESGAPIAAQVLCGEVSSLQLSAIPQSSDSRVVATRIYITNIDGTDFYAQHDVPAGVTAWSFNGFFADGALLRTQFMEPPPPGQLLEYNNGRIYIASGKVVWYTEPLRYGCVDLTQSFFAYSRRVTMLRGIKQGMYIGADKTYFLPGAGTKDVEQIILEDARPIEGASLKLPQGEEVVWLADLGFRRGTGGQASGATDDRIAMDQFTRAALGLVEQNGLVKVVAVAEEGSPSTLVSEDFES